eukprot:gnl/MRDRNA2_/MRDRNA2_46506_c0_seq1.p1 gnl/MRDRNA2_/MRDRNA2_46506_c0~~gnl/MRDRNA2_/MRDRNA2_46506_c0_seq1.p1  ORF type:complete len:392 (+),score=101.73 gnl/MRDRNA2_/MRDRNA2_46506_c0_seq1:109-1284(+)
MSATDPMNGADDDSDEENGAQSIQKGTEYLQKQQAKQMALLRRQALIKGMQAGTSGVAQDCLYTIFDITSQLLVLAQLYINIKSVWGGGGCNKGKAVSMEIIWFWIQTVLNSIVTVAQFVLWFWSFGVTGMFCCSFKKCPTSKDAQTTHPAIAYREMLAKQNADGWDDMDDEERQELLDQQPTAEELKDPDGEYFEDFKTFKKELGTLGRIHSLQGTVTNMRSIIGALGTIIEPMMAAASGMSSVNVEAAAETAVGKISLDTSAAQAGKDATEQANKLAAQAQEKLKKAAEEAENLKRCFTNRQISATGSGFIAAIGAKQAALKNSYMKLVVLAHMREKDIAQFEAAKKNEDPNAKRKVPDEAIETELQSLLGPDGQKYLSYLSGSEAPQQ